VSGFVSSSDAPNKKMRKIALQLYTVRESLQKDYLGTLKQVADAGYKGVEMAGDFGGMSAKELRAVMNDLGLQVISGHILPNHLSNGLAETVDTYNALGAGYLGLAWMPPEMRDTKSAWQNSIPLIKKAAEQVANGGMTFVYHNHDFEFEKFDGQHGLDLLWSSTDPKQVKSELDVYWVKKAGVDPRAYLESLGGRAPLLHIKDMNKEDQSWEIIGDGTLDFENILKTGDALGVDWYIVEQDKCPKGELVSIRRSHSNLVANGWL
jgi:sugar phosphate isomerase/epimerase